MTNPDITQLNVNTTPLRYNQTKGLTGRPNEKIAWATTLMSHQDILTSYEEGLHKLEEEKQQTKQEWQPPDNTAKQSAPPSKSKEKMPSMERQVPDTLKQLRKKQAAEDKLLAAQHK